MSGVITIPAWKFGSLLKILTPDAKETVGKGYIVKYESKALQTYYQFSDGNTVITLGDHIVELEDGGQYLIKQIQRSGIFLVTLQHGQKTILDIPTDRLWELELACRNKQEFLLDGTKYFPISASQDTGIISR